MEKVVFVFLFVFVGLISVTYTLNKDETELLRRLVNDLTNQNNNNHAKNGIKRKSSMNDVPDVNVRERFKENGFGNQRVGTRQKLENSAGHEHHVRFPEQQSKNINKDDDLLKALDSFLQAKRARDWMRWIQNDLSHKGTETVPSTTTSPPPPPTTIPTTKKPSRSPWCRVSFSWWWWRRPRC